MYINGPLHIIIDYNIIIIVTYLLSSYFTDPRIRSVQVKAIRRTSSYHEPSSIQTMKDLGRNFHLHIFYREVMQI